MQYNYIRDNDLPIVVTLTYEDIKIIHRMAEIFVHMKERPDGIYICDVRKLEREARDVLNSIRSTTQALYPEVYEKTDD